MKTLCHKDTVGSLRFAHLFFLITQPWMHQSSKSLCPLLREVPEDSKTPTCKVWMILCHVIAIERKLLFSKIDLIWMSTEQCVCHFVIGYFISQILCKLCKLGLFWNPQGLSINSSAKKFFKEWPISNTSGHFWPISF